MTATNAVQYEFNDPNQCFDMFASTRGTGCDFPLRCSISVSAWETVPRLPQLLFTAALKYTETDEVSNTRIQKRLTGSVFQSDKAADLVFTLPCKMFSTIHRRFDTHLCFSPKSNIPFGGNWPPWGSEFKRMNSLPIKCRAWKKMLHQVLRVVARNKVDSSTFVELFRPKPAHGILILLDLSPSFGSRKRRKI